jgi:hypothetical protein
VKQEAGAAVPVAAPSEPAALAEAAPEGTPAKPTSTSKRQGNIVSLDELPAE